MRDAELIVIACIATAVAGALCIDAIGYGDGMRVLGFPAFIRLAIVLLCGLRAWQRRREAGRAVGSEPASAGVRQTIRVGHGFLAVVPAVVGWALVDFRCSWRPIRAARRGLAGRYCGGHDSVGGRAAVRFVFGVPQPKGLLAWP